MLFRWVIPFLSLATNATPELSEEFRQAFLNVRAPGLTGLRLSRVRSEVMFSEIEWQSLYISHIEQNHSKSKYEEIGGGISSD